MNPVKKALEKAMKKHMSGPHKTKSMGQAKGAKVTAGFGKMGKPGNMSGGIKKSGKTKYHGAM